MLSDIHGHQLMNTPHHVLLIVKLRLPPLSHALRGPAASHPRSKVTCGALQAGGKPKAGKKKQKAAQRLAQKQGDAFMQELVQAASKLGLLAAEDDDSNDTGGDAAGGSAAREGQLAPGEAATQGQEAWQTTPLPQSVGAKRKRLPGTAGA